MAKTVVIKIEVKNNSGTVIESKEYTKSYSTTGIDLEYEVVEDSNGGPLVRPKHPPKY